MTPPEISRNAEFIFKSVLGRFITNNRLQLPQLAVETNLPKSSLNFVTSPLRIRVHDSSLLDASVDVKGSRISLSSAWVCQRWCSTYITLQANFKPKEGSALIGRTFGSNFNWPEGIPTPDTSGSEPVGNTNNIFPWVLMATVLHEIGHIAYTIGDQSQRETEFACDRFAAMYLVGYRDFPTRDVRMSGIALWHCGMCAESLGPSPFSSQTHPHPIARLLRYLEEFVPRDTELGLRLWLLCAANLVQLGNFHGRPVEDALDQRFGSDVAAIFNALKECWHF